MCGIAGRILNAPGRVGSDLVDLMDAQAHRGSDSTGFAIYGIARESGFVLRGMGFDRSRIDRDIASVGDTLKSHGTDFAADPDIVDDRSPHYCFRAEIGEPDDMSAWIHDVDTLSDHIEIQSCGRSLEIIKDVGNAEEVAEKHGIRDLIGTHGLGHARLATESSVRPDASHPFWARPFPDISIVHNGQITDYHSRRDRLMREGYRFMTENDSELIAVWISDQMKKGLDLAQALAKSVTAIDGVFTFMIATGEGIGFAKDRFAMKPLVVIDRDGKLAAATEEQALRRIHADECDVLNIDGPGITGLWPIDDRSRAA